MFCSRTSGFSDQILSEYARDSGSFLKPPGTNSGSPLTRFKLSLGIPTIQDQNDLVEMALADPLCGDTNHLVASDTDTSE